MTCVKCADHIHLHAHFKTCQPHHRNFSISSDKSRNRESHGLVSDADVCNLDWIGRRTQCAVTGTSA